MNGVALLARPKGKQPLHTPAGRSDASARAHSRDASWSGSEGGSKVLVQG